MYKYCTCLFEEKGMAFDHGFCYSFSFSSFLVLGGKIKGEENNQSPGKKSFLSARSVCIT